VAECLIPWSMSASRCVRAERSGYNRDVHPLHRSALLRLGIAAGVGVLAVVVAVIFAFWYVAAEVGWDAAALTYLALTLPAVWRLDSDHTAHRASSEDPTHAATDLVLLFASVVSLGALGVVLVRAGDTHGATELILTVLGVFSVVVSWTVVHVTYMLRYARLYYSDPVGGVSFNQDDPPCYSDFAYLAFTIGMTFQVSDTSLASRPMRATALKQALLSYLFGTVILATTINFVAGLAR
jgi:uncharacterized membrane protein